MDEANSSRSRVFGDPNLLTEILVRVPSARQVARSIATDQAFRTATAADDFVEQYMQHQTASIISFLVEFESVFGGTFQLFDAEAAPADDTVLALRPRINVAALQGDSVVASRGGFVLRTNNMHPHNYAVSCPTDVPRLYTDVAPPLPPIPRFPNQYTVNTYGQFGIVPDAGPPGGMAFFKLDIDPGRLAARTCEGITFRSPESVHVHVSVYSNGQWNRYFTEPIQPIGRIMFNRNPSCILGANSLFIMYLVGYIIRFDLTDHTFDVLPMPPPLCDDLRSDFQYAVGEHSQGGVTLAHFMHGQLYTWHLIPLAGVLGWHFVSRIDIMQVFIRNFGVGFWVNFLHGMDAGDPYAQLEFHSVQPRAVSLNGSLVMLTIAFSNGLYVLDTVSGSIASLPQIDPDALLGHIYTLTEPWPPRFR